jgi:hypothetical protein
MKLRIAFDLDKTLGVPIIQADSITGFLLRDGAHKLLQALRQEHTLLLWSVSSHNYVEKCLSYGLGDFFSETYSWDEIACSWKDLRKIRADYLIDDNPDHQVAAAKHGLATRDIVVSPFGSLEDIRDPSCGVRQIESALSLKIA